MDALPLTLDDPLEFKLGTLRGDVPLFTATFDNMTSTTTGIAFSLRGVKQDQLYYLALLPALLTDAGVTENGQRVSYDEMQERLRNEILALEASFSVNDRSERYELVVRGSGNDAGESRKAIAWMQSVLLHPDWDARNLPRLRDLVDQSLSGLRNMRQGYEERWVSGVSAAYRRQDSPLFLATSSFLTQTHSALRLRWQLMEGTASNRAEAAQFLARLAGAGSASRAELKNLVASLQGDSTAGAPPALLAPFQPQLGALPEGSRKIALEAAKDLAQTIEDLPDATLAADWSDLCYEMRHDLLVTPERALVALGAVRQEIVKSGNARVFMIGSGTNQSLLTQPILATLAKLGPGASEQAAYASRPIVLARLGGRAPTATSQSLVGLLNLNTQGGVFMNSAPFVSYTDTDDESLLRYLAYNLYSGGGAHSIFMKTWGAGLAYSNGLSASLENGRASYYADKTPELPQTLRFVIDQLKHAPRDSSLTDYSVALAFGSRAASAYEDRGEAMAANLADGLTPEVVSGFRKAILGIRKRVGLADALFDRMPGGYARVLPGFSGPATAVPGAVYFVIGAEKQFAAYEAYLKSVQGPESRLYRLYPRDFWTPALEPAADR